MNLFTRAGLNKPLTPFERALLRAVDGLVFTFGAAALPIVWQAFTEWQAGTVLTVNWGLVIDNAAKVGAIAVGYTVVKYIRAVRDEARGHTTDVGHVQGQSSLPTVLGTVESATGLSGEMIGQIADAVGSMLDSRLGEIAAQTKPVPVAPVPATPVAVPAIASLQAFSLPAGHVAVQTPNGLFVAAPADALPPVGSTSGGDGRNDVVTLAPSSSPDAASADSAQVVPPVVDGPSNDGAGGEMSASA